MRRALSYAVAAVMLCAVAVHASEGPEPRALSPQQALAVKQLSKQLGRLTVNQMKEVAGHLQGHEQVTSLCNALSELGEDTHAADAGPARLVLGGAIGGSEKLINGVYHKTQETVNGAATYKRDDGKQWVCQASNGNWYVQSTDAKGMPGGWAYTTDKAPSESSTWRVWSGVDWASQKLNSGSPPKAPQNLHIKKQIDRAETGLARAEADSAVKVAKILTSNHLSVPAAIKQDALKGSAVDAGKMAKLVKPTAKPATAKILKHAKLTAAKQHQAAGAGNKQAAAAVMAAAAAKKRKVAAKAADKQVKAKAAAKKEAPTPAASKVATANPKLVKPAAKKQHAKLTAGKQHPAAGADNKQAAAAVTGAAAAKKQKVAAKAADKRVKAQVAAKAADKQVKAAAKKEAPTPAASKVATANQKLVKPAAKKQHAKLTAGRQHPAAGADKQVKAAAKEEAPTPAASKMATANQKQVPTLEKAKGNAAPHATSLGESKGPKFKLSAADRAEIEATVQKELKESEQWEKSAKSDTSP